MTQYSISIITPCFNAGKLVGELADSLEQQTFKDFEWIIADDGSSNATLDILEQIEKRPNLTVKVSYGAHEGGNACRNRGFSLSSSPHVKFVDADDLLSHDLLEHQFASAQQNSGAMIVSPTTILRIDGTRLFRPIAERTDDVLARYMKSPWFMHGGCLIPRHLVDEIGGWDETLKIGQDLDFFRRLLLLTSPEVVANNESSFIYRHHDNAPRLSNPKSNLEGIYTGQKLALDKFADLLKQENKFEQYSSLLATNYDRWATSAAANYPDMCEPLLASAKSLSVNYQIPGGHLYRFLRRIVGIRLAAKITKLPIAIKLYDWAAKTRLRNNVEIS